MVVVIVLEKTGWSRMAGKKEREIRELFRETCGRTCQFKPDAILRLKQLKGEITREEAERIIKTAHANGSLKIYLEDVEAVIG